MREKLLALPAFPAADSAWAVGAKEKPAVRWIEPLCFYTIVRRQSSLELASAIRHPLGPPAGRLFPIFRA